VRTEYNTKPADKCAEPVTIAFCIIAADEDIVVTVRTGETEVPPVEGAHDADVANDALVFVKALN
jgi:hypothetical protein